MSIASRVLTPSQFTTLARSLLEDSFPLVEIEGELSNLSRPASGHLYFNLKDAQAQIRCAMFRPKSQWLKFKPSDGDKVLVRARATLYEPRGDFQLLVDHIAPSGEGALRAAFEQLKRQLESEGLFDVERKRPIPRWINRLGVITSPSGAAIQDVLTVLRRRFPLMAIEVLPVQVQGEAAARQIVEMLSKADRSGRYDTLLLTRGGGSLEDLMAFNDEGLSRAVFACRTPVVAAIGHETDTSIVELVADLRAPTPSAAAEALSPDQADLRPRLASFAAQLQRHQKTRQQMAAQRLDHLQLRLLQLHPNLRWSRYIERLAALKERMRHRQASTLTLLRERLSAKRQRLRSQSPANAVVQKQRACSDAALRLDGAMTRLLDLRRQRSSALTRTLEAMAPQATLLRGYAIVQRDAGGVVASIKGLHVAERLNVRVADGTLAVEVAAIAENAPHSR